MDIPIIESMAVMGRVNRFFEKAGMAAFTDKMPLECVRMIEALSMVGIEGRMLVQAALVQQTIEGLAQKEAEFIEFEMCHFLEGYGKRRYMAAGIERVRFILGKLTARPVYYIWLNEKTELSF